MLQPPGSSPQVPTPRLQAPGPCIQIPRIPDPSPIPEIIMRGMSGEGFHDSGTLLRFRANPTKDHKTCRIVGLCLFFKGLVWFLYGLCLGFLISVWISGFMSGCV